MTSALQPRRGASGSGCGCVVQRVKTWLGGASAFAHRMLIMELNHYDDFLRE